jgi:hypothetical protein
MRCCLKAVRARALTERGASERASDRAVWSCAPAAAAAASSSLHASIDASSSISPSRPRPRPCPPSSVIQLSSIQRAPPPPPNHNPPPPPPPPLRPTANGSIAAQVGYKGSPTCNITKKYEGDDRGDFKTHDDDARTASGNPDLIGETCTEGRHSSAPRNTVPGAGPHNSTTRTRTFAHKPSTRVAHPLPRGHSLEGIIISRSSPSRALRIPTPASASVTRGPVVVYAVQRSPGSH